MKNIILSAILLTITCGARSQNNDHCLDHDQLKKVYTKVVRGEQCERKLDSAKRVAVALHGVVENQNRNIQQSLKLIVAQNDSIASANERLTAKSVELQAVKDKKRPWYEWLILGAAAALGVIVAK